MHPVHEGPASSVPSPRASRSNRALALLLCALIAAAGVTSAVVGLEAWVEAWLPPRLLGPGPGGAPLWRLLVSPLALLVAWSLGFLLSRLSLGLLAQITQRTATRWDEALLARIGAPLTLAWMLLPTYFLLPWFGLRGLAHSLAPRLLHAGFLVALFWSLSRSLDVLRQGLIETPWVRTRPGTQSLLPLAVRCAKVALWALGFVAVLSELGYPIASLIAGLGIGGLAVALAAQKTVENLFGAVSIGADQPFRVGDFVRIEDFVGTIEAIGLRSTKIRTLDRTLVTLPNGRLAEMRLESFSARDRMRLACEIGLVYSTTPAQVRQVLSGLEQVLREQPKIWPDAVVVRLKELGASSLNIEVMAWFQTPEWSEFQLIRQDVLLLFMEVVAQAGTSFAFPTRTVHLIAEQESRSPQP